MTHLVTGDGTRLAYRDHPGPGPTVLLLHGLAGHLGEWDDLAGRLAASGCRVVSYDARGHGGSTRRPVSVSRAAHVADAVAVLRELDLAPAVVIGQSLGGHTAMLLAAAHPELARALVLVEAGPAGPGPELPSAIADWLDRWPVPFPSRAEATSFLGHEAWARGLEERPDGLHPRFDRATLVATMTELAADGYWTPWSRVRCPTLLVRGATGTMDPGEAAEMLTARPGTRAVVVPDAAHDVHLDQPESLHTEIVTFLKEERVTDVLLETERLRLRAFTEADAGHLVALDGDPEVMRFLTGGVPTPADEIRARTLPRLLHDHPGLGTRGYWAAEEKATGTFLGWFEFRPLDDTDPAVVELGYRLNQAAWGRGYATEGSRALIDKGFADLGVERVTANTMTVNHRSRRVMEKSGLTFLRTFHSDWPEPVEGCEHGEVEYALTRADWRRHRDEA